MLAEQTAHLIDQRGAALEQLLADPMQGLQWSYPDSVEGGGLAVNSCE
jgi:hypothetical protein